MCNIKWRHQGFHFQTNYVAIMLVFNVKLCNWVDGVTVEPLIIRETDFAFIFTIC